MDLSFVETLADSSSFGLKGWLYKPSISKLSSPLSPPFSHLVLSMDALSLISLNHKNILFPLRSGPVIHRLPVEILVEVFLFCQAPLLLSRVCSSWRRIALQTPALWTRLVMEVSFDDTWEVPEQHTQAASYWFSHAGSHLVDLVVRADTDYPSLHAGPNARYFADFMMELVWPRAERIRSLRLSFEGMYDICCLLQYQDDEDTLPHHVWNFPHLEYLTIDLDTFNVDGVELTALRSVPKLHTVVLGCVILSKEFDIHLPWAQLTSLTIEDIEEPLFPVLMAQCLALQTGCFSIRDTDFKEELPAVDATLTRLTTFTIHSVNEFNPSVLDGIHFPALNNFSLFLMQRIDDFVWKASEHMFRQLASITTLSLGEHITAPDMINILRATENVTTFKVEVEDGHGEVLKALTLVGGSGNGEVLLPKLGVVHVRECPRSHSEPFAVIAFVEMVASRSPGDVEAWGVAPLRDVWVGILPYPSTLKADVDAVLKEWGHKTDMPQVRYEEYQWY